MLGVKRRGEIHTMESSQTSMFRKAAGISSQPHLSLNKAMNGGGSGGGEAYKHNHSTYI